MRAAFLMAAFGLGGNVMKPLALQVLQGGISGLVVEIAHDDDLCPRWQKADGLSYPTGYQLAVGPRALLATKTTGGVDDEDVERVVAERFALNIQNVTSGAHTLQGGDFQTVVTDRAKGKGLIEQGHINAAHIGRLGHEVFVARIPQQRAPCKVEEATVVFDLD